MTRFTFNTIGLFTTHNKKMVEFYPDIKYNRAIAMGAKSVFQPQTMPRGQRNSYIADPEGNLIEINSFTK